MGGGLTYDSTPGPATRACPYRDAFTAARTYRPDSSSLWARGQPGHIPLSCIQTLASSILRSQLLPHPDTIP